MSTAVAPRPRSVSDASLSEQERSYVQSARTLLRDHQDEPVTIALREGGCLVHGSRMIVTFGPGRVSLSPVEAKESPVVSINEAVKLIPTKNTDWGFYGTVRGMLADGDAIKKQTEDAWAVAFRFLAGKYAKESSETIRALLDSKFGRWMGDAVDLTAADFGVAHAFQRAGGDKEALAQIVAYKQDPSAWGESQQAERGVQVSEAIIGDISVGGFVTADGKQIERGTMRRFEDEVRKRIWERLDFAVRDVILDYFKTREGVQLCIKYGLRALSPEEIGESKLNEDYGDLTPGVFIALGSVVTSGGQGTPGALMRLVRDVESSPAYDDLVDDLNKRANAWAKKFFASRTGKALLDKHKFEVVDESVRESKLDKVSGAKIAKRLQPFIKSLRQDAVTDKDDPAFGSHESWADQLGQLATAFATGDARKAQRVYNSIERDAYRSLTSFDDDSWNDRGNALQRDIESFVESKDEPMTSKLTEDDYAEILTGDTGLELYVNGELLATEDCDLNDQDDCARAEAVLSARIEAEGFEVDESEKDASYEKGGKVINGDEEDDWQEGESMSQRRIRRQTTKAPPAPKGWLTGESTEVLLGDVTNFLAEHLDPLVYSEGIQAFDNAVAEGDYEQAFAEAESLAGAVTKLDEYKRMTGSRLSRFRRSIKMQTPAEKLRNRQRRREWKSNASLRRKAAKYRVRVKRFVRRLHNSEGSPETKVDERTLTNLAWQARHGIDETMRQKLDAAAKGGTHYAYVLIPSTESKDMPEIEVAIVEVTKLSEARFENAVVVYRTDGKATRESILGKLAQLGEKFGKGGRNAKPKDDEEEDPDEEEPDANPDDEEDDEEDDADESVDPLLCAVIENLTGLRGKPITLTGLHSSLVEQGFPKEVDTELMTTLSRLVNQGGVRYERGKGYVLEVADGEALGKITKAARAAGMKFVVTLTGGQPIFLTDSEAAMEFWKGLHPKMRGAKQSITTYLKSIGAEAEEAEAEEE